MLKVKNFMSSLLSDKNKINMGDNVKFVNEFVNFVFNDTEHVEPLMIQVWGNTNPLLFEESVHTLVVWIFCRYAD